MGNELGVDDNFPLFEFQAYFSERIMGHESATIQAMPTDVTRAEMVVHISKNQCTVVCMYMYICTVGAKKKFPYFT